LYKSEKGTTLLSERGGFESGVWVESEFGCDDE